MSEPAASVAVFERGPISETDERCQVCGSKYVEWVPEEDAYLCEEDNPLEEDQ